MPRKKTTEEARQRVLQHARDFQRPFPSGPIAVALHMSLAEAESLLTDMVQEGTIRRLTPRELSDNDLRDGYCLA